MNAEYAEGVEPNKYLDLSQTEPTLGDFELDPSKVCLIDNPDCEACE